MSLNDHFIERRRSDHILDIEPASFGAHLHTEVYRSSEYIAVIPIADEQRTADSGHGFLYKTELIGAEGDYAASALHLILTDNLGDTLCGVRLHALDLKEKFYIGIGDRIKNFGARRNRFAYIIGDAAKRSKINTFDINAVDRRVVMYDRDFVRR